MTSKMVRCGTSGNYFYVPEPHYSKTDIDNMLWAAYQRNRNAVVERPYVSIYPVCPPANYPEPLSSQNMGLTLAQLPQPVPGRQCPPAQPPLWSKKRASSRSKKTG